jgi:hypothetical protein
MLLPGMVKNDQPHSNSTNTILPGTATRTASNVLVFLRDPWEKACHLLPGYFECFPGDPIVGTQYQTYEEPAVRAWTEIVLDC